MFIICGVRDESTVVRYKGFRATLNLCECSQYAAWEEQQKDFRRARSVWERCLDVSYTNPGVWTKVSGFKSLGTMLMSWMQGGKTTEMVIRQCAQSCWLER